MTGRRWIQLGAAFLFVFLLAALNAQAQEGANAGGGEGGPVALFKWINIAIVVGLTVWACLKGSPFFRRNAEVISSAISKSIEAKKAAESQLREAESKLAHLQEEITALRDQARRQAAVEAERLRNITQNDLERVGIAARAEIEAAERAARLKLKALAADLAVKGAEALLADELTPPTQQALVNSFVKSLEGSPN